MKNIIESSVMIYGVGFSIPIDLLLPESNCPKTILNQLTVPNRNFTVSFSYTEDSNTEEKKDKLSFSIPKEITRSQIRYFILEQLAKEEDGN